MNAKRITALVAAALVMGLVAGNVASSFAATATTANAGTGTGLRLGVAMRDSGGRLLDVVAKLTGTSHRSSRRRASGRQDLHADRGSQERQVLDGRRRGAQGPHDRAGREGEERRHHAGPG